MTRSPAAESLFAAAGQFDHPAPGGMRLSLCGRAAVDGHQSLLMQQEEFNVAGPEGGTYMITNLCFCAVSYAADRPHRYSCAGPDPN